MATAPTVTAIGKPKELVALPATGTVVGRYTLLEQLGAGAMGAVFLASDPELGRRVAIKLLVARGADEHKLLDEARALAKLQHPNVVAIHDVGRWEGQVYIAMEHIAGASLDKWLEQHAVWRVRLDAFVQAAHGLAAAHRAGIVHHDVKPSNIMVGEDGRVRLVDFGLARSHAPELALGSTAGTPRYMSPEQRRGTVADARTDQFSLCVGLYEAMWGTHPFEGDTHEQRTEAVLSGRIRQPGPSHVPAKTRDAILRGLAGEPDQRHPSMDALINALAAPRSRRALWLGGAAVVVAAAAGIVGAVAFHHDEPAPPVAKAGKWDAILAASHLEPDLKEALPGDPFGVTVHHLANGLTVMIAPNHDLPRVRAVFRFRAGSADAPGVALLAHSMMHRGTERIGTTDFAKEKPHLVKIRELYLQRPKAIDPAARARIDAAIDAETVAAAPFEIADEHTRLLEELAVVDQSTTTYRDQTRFYMDLPSNRFEAWATLEGDRFAHPVMRMFRSTVAESATYGRANKSDRMSDLVDAVMPKVYPRYRYGYVADAIPDAIDREPYAEVENYIQQWYVPNNAELILTGDLDPTTALPILEKAFAGWEPRTLPDRPPPAFQPAPAETIQLATKSTDHWVTLVWAFPRGTMKAPAFGPLLHILDRRLGVHHDNPRTAFFLGTMIVGVAPHTGESEAEATAAIEGTIAELRAGTITDAELLGATRSLRVGHLVNDLESSLRLSEIAGSIDDFDELTWRERVALDTAVGVVTKADIAALATKLFSSTHLTVSEAPSVVEQHGVTPPKVPPVKYAQGHGQLGQALIAQEVVPVQPRFLVVGTDYDEKAIPGGYLVAKQNKRTKLFTLTIRYDFGFHDVPFTCDALEARAKTVQPAMYDGAFYTLDRACTSRKTYLNITGLDDQLEDAIELLSAEQANPTSEEWTRMVKDHDQWVPALSQRTDWIDAFAERLVLFGKREFVTDSAVLHAATPADGVKAAIRLRRGTRYFSYYGPRSLDEVAKLLPPKEPGKPTVGSGQHPLAGKPRVVLLDAKSLSPVANVDVLYGMGKMDEPLQQAELEVFQQYWSFDLHPIGDQMRGASRFEVKVNYPQQTRDDGWVSFRIKAPPGEAIAAIDRTVDAVFAKPLDPALFARAKESRDETLRTSWIRKHDTANKVVGWRMMGLRGDPRELIRARWNRLGPAELAALTKELHTGAHAILIWGNLDGIDRAALAKKYGKVETLTLGDLLGLDAKKPAGKGGHPAGPRPKRRGKR